MADEKAPSFCSARLFPIRPAGMPTIVSIGRGEELRSSHRELR